MARNGVRKSLGAGLALAICAVFVPGGAREQRGGPGPHRLEAVRRAVAVRQRRCAAGLASPRRTQDPARGDPPPRQPARQADRHLFLQPRRPREPPVSRSSRTRPAPGCSTRPETGVSTSSAGTRAASAPAPASAASAAPGGAGAVLGRPDDPDDGCLPPLPAQGRRLRASLRRRQRRAAAPHLHRRHGSRPRPPEDAGRRTEVELRGLVLRNVPGPDLRERLSEPGSGHGARRRGRRRTLRHEPGEPRSTTSSRLPDRSSRSSSRCARPRARSTSTPTASPRGARWPARVRSRSAWSSCCGAPGATRSPPPPRTPRAPSRTASC